MLSSFIAIRDLALFNLAIDSKLRACDLVKIRVHGPIAEDPAPRAVRDHGADAYVIQGWTAQAAPAACRIAGFRLGTDIHISHAVVDRRPARRIGLSSNLLTHRNFSRIAGPHYQAKWIEQARHRERGAIEGYCTGLLFPKYGIYEEH